MKAIIAILITAMASITNAEVIRMHFEKPRKLEALSFKVEKDELTVCVIGRLETPKEGGYTAFDLLHATFKPGRLESSITMGSTSGTNAKDFLSSLCRIQKQTVLETLLIDKREKEVTVYILTTRGVYRISYEAATSIYKMASAKHPKLKPDLSILFSHGNLPKQLIPN